MAAGPEAMGTHACPVATVVQRSASGQRAWRNSGAAWAQKYPKTAAAFVRAIEAGQLIADTDPEAVQAAIAKYDNLGPLVTTAMALSGYPVGPVSKPRIQRVAQAMLQFGFLSHQDAAVVERGALVQSMVGSAS
jgi:hypothetical protein